MGFKHKSQIERKMFSDYLSGLLISHEKTDGGNDVDNDFEVISTMMATTSVLQMMKRNLVMRIEKYNLSHV